MRHLAPGDMAMRGSGVAGKHNEGVMVSTRCGHIGPGVSLVVKRLSNVSLRVVTGLCLAVRVGKPSQRYHLEGP